MTFFYDDLRPQPYGCFFLQNYDTVVANNFYLMQEPSMSANQGPVYQHIIDIARQHNIPYEQNDVDVMVCAITRLSDNDVVSNDATRAVANLRRAKIIDTPHAHKLLLSLLAEMRMP